MRTTCVIELLVKCASSNMESTQNTVWHPWDGSTICFSSTWLTAGSSLSWERQWRRVFKLASRIGCSSISYLNYDLPSSALGWRGRNITIAEWWSPLLDKEAPILSKTFHTIEGNISSAVIHGTLSLECLGWRNRHHLASKQVWRGSQNDNNNNNNTVRIPSELG